MQNTTNLNLKKPDQTDYVNITDINDNMDVIDTALAKKYEKPSTGVPKTDLAQSIQNSLEKAETALQKVDKNSVGLGNVDNTSDANKPISTTTQSALNLKAPLASPTFTGAPTAPTPAESTNNTQLATTEFVQKKVAAHQTETVHVHWIGTATGTNSLTATYASIAELKEGLGVSFKNTTASTDATTLNINGLGAIPILKSTGTAVTNLKANGVYTLRYVGGNFILQGEGGEYGTATANEVLPGYSIGTENGLVSGLYSNVKSIQVATITYRNTTSYTLNINAVNVSNCIVIPIISMPGGNIAFQPVVELTSPTTVTLSSTTPSDMEITIQIYIVEFNNVKNKLTGSFTNSTATTFTTAISTVNPSKCLAFGTVSSSSSAVALNLARVTVAANLLTVDVYAGPNKTGKIVWQILELK